MLSLRDSFQYSFSQRRSWYFFELLLLHQSEIFRCLDLAFPPPDDAVRTHIVSKALAAGTTAEDIERFYLCFLATLFSKTKDKLEGGRSKQQKGTKTLAAWWRDHLREPGVRSQLYSSVVDEAQTFTAETVSPMSRTVYVRQASIIIVSHRSMLLQERPRMRSKNSP